MGTTELNSGQYISKTEPQGGKGPKTNKDNEKPGKKKKINHTSKGWKGEDCSA